MTILVSRVTAVCVRWTATQPSLYLAQKCTSHYDICSNRLLTRIALHPWYNKPLMCLCKGTEAIFCNCKKRGSVTMLIYSCRYPTSWGRSRTALNTLDKMRATTFVPCHPVMKKNSSNNNLFSLTL